MAETNQVPILFLGTPSVVCPALKAIFDNPYCKLVGVVTQPTRSKLGSKESQLTPVHQLALRLNLPVLCPEKCSDADFLKAVSDLGPLLCLTAAFGQLLPQKFLDIPALGTFNIHPSILPKYRGAAPVQHTLLNGDTEAGVTVCKTVLAMDAGPILAQKRVAIDNTVQSPALLEHLFQVGIELFLGELPKVVEGTSHLVPQTGTISFARKLTTEDSVLLPTHTLREIHCKVRALAGWPGTKAWIRVGAATPQWVKILETRLVNEPDLNYSKFEDESSPGKFYIRGNRLFWPGVHRDTTGESLTQEVLEVTKLQLPGKRALDSSDFLNGFKMQDLFIEEPKSAH